MVEVPRWALHFAGLIVPRIRSNLAADAGDIRRIQQDWNGAATNYRRAVRICPGRRSIWVQLGHALKEAGRPDEAIVAYRKASAVHGTDGDAPSNLGVLARQSGQFVEAQAAFLQAYRENPDYPGVRAEFVAMLHEPRAVGENAKVIAHKLAADEATRLESLGSDGTGQGPSDGDSDGDSDCDGDRGGGAKVVFDASDLISYFRHSRLPTGIQRVQIEVIRAALAAHPLTQVTCFSAADVAWPRIPAAHFLHLCDLAVSGSDRLDQPWIDALEVLGAGLGLAVPVAFARGGFLVNLGTSWWLQNYFLHVRAAQRSHGIHYVPFVHDLIPVIAPEYFVRELTQDFLSWAQNVFDHADFFLVNSHCTQADLHKVANILGHTIVPAHVRVVPLNADFRRPGLTGVSPDHLTEWNLEPGGYVLFVSTIEPRKNHLLAFRAWQTLIARHGAASVPDLVCVGNRGWLNDHVYAALERDPALAAKVHILSHLSDEHLALLYSQCRFTLYPSAYEGWGLPVTESLCFGKVPLTNRCASLPEAGGDFAVYVEPGDEPALVAALDRLMFDTGERKRREAFIHQSFRPRSWNQVASQIADDLGNFIQLAGSAQTHGTSPAIQLDRLYRLTRNRRTRLASDTNEGEQLRSGIGWWEPEDWGCPTRSDGGSMAFSVADTTETVRCWLRLRGPAGRAGEAIVTCGDRELRCDLPADGWRWMSFLAQARNGKVAFHIRGHSWDTGGSTTQLHALRDIGVGVGGLIASSCLDARSVSAMGKVIAKIERGPFGFLRELYPLLLNREIDSAELEDFLVPMESGNLNRSGVVDVLARNADSAIISRQAIVFD